MVGVGGLLVTLTNADDTGVVSWLWELLDSPLNSAVVPGTLGTTASETFMPDTAPDTPGCYRVKLTVQGADGSVACDVKNFAVPTTQGWILPPFRASATELNFPGNTEGWESLVNTIFLSLATGGTDELVKASAADTTAKVLDQKLAAGTNISLSLLNPGGDEQVEVSSTGVPAARILTAGAGLTGGGDLSADRTFDVIANADGSIAVNANDVQVGVLATDAQHGTRGGGAQHAVVVPAGANGFMSGADKTKLDGLTDTLVKASAADTTPKVLDQKIAAGTNISLALLNPGADEQLQITASGGGAPGISVTLGANVTAGDPIKIQPSLAGPFLAYPIEGERATGVDEFNDNASPFEIASETQWAANVSTNIYPYDGCAVTPFKICIIWVDAAGAMQSIVGDYNATHTAVVFGTPQTIATSGPPLSSVSVDTIDSTHVGLLYVSNGAIRSRILTISGTTITPGTEFTSGISSGALRVMWRRGRLATRGAAVYSRSTSDQGAVMPLNINIGTGQIFNDAGPVGFDLLSGGLHECVNIARMDGDKYGVMAGSDYRLCNMYSDRGPSQTMAGSSSGPRIPRLDTTGTLSGGETFLLAPGTARPGSGLILPDGFFDLYRPSAAGATDYVVTNFVRAIGSGLHVESPGRFKGQQTNLASKWFNNVTIRGLTHRTFAIGAFMRDSVGSRLVVQGFGTVNGSDVHLSLGEYDGISVTVDMQDHAHVLPIKLIDNRFALVTLKPAATPTGVVRTFEVTDRHMVVAVSSVTDISGNTITPSYLGSTVTVPTWSLTPGIDYYIDPSGAISDSISPWPIGRAINSTTLLLRSMDQA